MTHPTNRFEEVRSWMVSVGITPGDTPLLLPLRVRKSDDGRLLVSYAKYRPEVPRHPNEITYHTTSTSIEPPGFTPPTWEANEFLEGDAA